MFSLSMGKVFFMFDSVYLRYIGSSVSQELSDLIMTMVQNCSLMLSKNTMNRPPPPGVLRHRGLEPFNPAALGSQVVCISLFFCTLYPFVLFKKKKNF